MFLEKELLAFKLIQKHLFLNWNAFSKSPTCKTPCSYSFVSGMHSVPESDFIISHTSQCWNLAVKTCTFELPSYVTHQNTCLPVKWESLQAVIEKVDMSENLRYSFGTGIFKWLDINGVELIQGIFFKLCIEKSEAVWRVLEVAAFCVLTSAYQPCLELHWICTFTAKFPMEEI